MKNREELHGKNKKKLKNYNIHIRKKVGDRKDTDTKLQRYRRRAKKRKRETQESQENVLNQHSAKGTQGKISNR